MDVGNKSLPTQADGERVGVGYVLYIDPEIARGCDIGNRLSRTDLMQLKAMKKLMTIAGKDIWRKRG